jgi:hypothetical protein
MSKWAAKYKDSRWQKKRLEVMERDGWTCQSCGATGPGTTLNVHHVYYESGKAPWEYPTETLRTWCEDCHKCRQEKQRDVLLGVSYADIHVFLGLYQIILANTGLLSELATCGLDPVLLARIVKKAVASYKNGGVV